MFSMKRYLIILSVIFLALMTACTEIVGPVDEVPEVEEAETHIPNLPSEEISEEEADDLSSDEEVVEELDSSEKVSDSEDLHRSQKQQVEENDDKQHVKEIAKKKAEQASKKPKKKAAKKSPKKQTKQAQKTPNTQSKKQPSSSEKVEELFTASVSVSLPDGVDGPDFGPEKMNFKEGETAYDLLLKTALHIEATGAGKSIYVRGIDGLKEMDEGPMSGWRYRVDGDYPAVGAGAFELKDGQLLEWIYTIDWTEQ